MFKVTKMLRQIIKCVVHDYYYSRIGFKVVFWKNLSFIHNVNTIISFSVFLSGHIGRLYCVCVWILKSPQSLKYMQIENLLPIHKSLSLCMMNDTNYTTAKVTITSHYHNPNMHWLCVMIQSRHRYLKHFICQ